MQNNIDVRDYDELNSALYMAQHTVFKKYLSELTSYPLLPPDDILKDRETRDYVRAFQLKQLTCKKGEDIFQKLSTVYHASMSLGCSLFLMIDVKAMDDPADIYLGIRRSGDLYNEDSDKHMTTSYNALRRGLESNFPGTQTKEISASKELTKLVNDIFGQSSMNIAAVSCVAAVRDKKKTEHKDFIQGLEKMIDAMRGHTYTALLIAEPVSPQQQEEMRSGYERLYSTLSSFQKSVWIYNENESKAVMESLSKGIAEAVTVGTSQTQSHTAAEMKGDSNTVGIGVNIGGNYSRNKSRTETEGKISPTTMSRIGNVLSAGDLGAKLGTTLGAAAGTLLGPFGAALGGKIGGMIGGAATAAMQGSSVTESIAKQIGSSAGISGGLGINASHTNMHSTTESDTTANTSSRSTSNTTTENTTTGTTNTTGSGKNLQIENVNKPIVEMLQRIDEQLKRIREGEDYGTYSCGAYFISSKQESSVLAANVYRALMIGEGTAVENGAINVWQSDKKDVLTKEPVVESMKEYLRRFVQPVFIMPLKEKPENESDWVTYDPGTIVSGLELPFHLGLPTKSVVGLPVVEHAEFGRNVETGQADQTISLGSLYHMGQAEEVEIELKKDSLASHTFVTGSTGSGKSNTICHMLNELSKQKIPFLVVEPAKGEYKNVFGGREDVAVYGTNSLVAPLLRLNPFSFPESIHVLEHIDRLVEIFNACWPMYAAMPAVLKDAVEKSYIRRGWNLITSQSVEREFPTFRDLMEVLPDVIRESCYSADTQSDYIGALYTRIKSLTNGINGQIFCTYEELDDKSLFDQNVIVDLSRVGSMETKSLLMGIMVMRLQEYRMACGGMNRPLSHVTVLEEAHHLLRRTTDVQFQESSNLQGKSVEMISNAIAEMRTYGEGFIIADQAPGLMDASVIRNTNTKIIMRLPDEEDRKLVGKAAVLNEDQIVELAKLSVGIAAVYQNDWLEPVLCQIERFQDAKKYHYTPGEKEICMFAEQVCKFLLSAGKSRLSIPKEDADKLQNWTDHLNTSLEVKRILLNLLRVNQEFEEEKGRYLLYCIVKGRELIEGTEAIVSLQGRQGAVDQQIISMLDVSEQVAREIRKQIFLHAAEYNKDDAERHAELLYYGGIR